MSNVLAFRPASAGGPAQLQASHAAGEIIIFPGVRYERRDEPREPSPQPSQGGRGKRARRASK